MSGKCDLKIGALSQVEFDFCVPTDYALNAEENETCDNALFTITG
jgi:hypothetical protein